MWTDLNLFRLKQIFQIIDVTLQSYDVLNLIGYVFDRKYYFKLPVCRFLLIK